mgnify:CR=1 FL=1
MNRLSCRAILIRQSNPVFVQSRTPILNFGTWWNGDGGVFRRIRGQGPHQHKKYDFLDFKDRPDIAKKYPFLHRFILRRHRDQGLNKKFFVENRNFKHRTFWSKIQIFGEKFNFLSKMHV